MIFVTGDTHGLKDVEKFDSDYFLKNINKSDNFLIILGDCGATWNVEEMKKCIQFYDNFKCKVLFIDGNNENFDILDKLPTSKFCGGNVHKVSQNLIHLMRGEIFEIEGNKILAYGGADSWDAPFRYSGNRVEGKNWWKREQPSKEEFENMLNNLKKYDNKVDFILTHETKTLNLHNYFVYSNPYQTSKMLDKLEKIVNYRHWFFGHHHKDIDLSCFESCVFNKFHCLQEKKFCKYKNSIEDEKQIFEI